PSTPTWSGSRKRSPTSKRCRKDCSTCPPAERLGCARSAEGRRRARQQRADEKRRLHCTSKPASFTTLAHFAISPRTRAARSPGLDAAASTPASESFFCTSGELTARLA